jgi:hypothetical protein
MKKIRMITACLLIISNVRLSAQPFFSNTGFEEWDTMGLYYQPLGWYTLNELTQVGFESSTRITTDAFLGSFAAQLISVEGVFNNVAGILASGPLLDEKLIPDFNRLKRPYSARPHALKLHYKSFPAIMDTCALIMLLTKWNAITQQADTVGLASFSTGDTASVYTSVTIPFEYYSSDLPDSAYFIATSSLDGFNPQPGSTFIIDELSIQQFQTATAETQTMKLNVFPNPAFNEMNIHIAETDEPLEITICNISGKVVYTEKTRLHQLVLPIASWEPGMYIITIRTNHFTLHEKIVHP